MPNLWRWRTLLINTTFGIFYVMLEGCDQDGGSYLTFWTMVLQLIDAGQVLRSIVLAQYGWNLQITSAVEKMDLVRLLQSLVWDVIPPWVFFMVSSFLVLIAVLDTFYVGWLFNQGRADTIWPVKLLRFLVTAMVTTFFPNILEFVIFPINCYISKAPRDNLVWIVRGSGSDLSCEPFSVPVIAVTIPALLLAAVFIVFSMTASYLSFEINPLSQNPMAICTVEAIWTAFKTAAIVLVFKPVSPVAVSALISLIACYLFYKHAMYLPFLMSFSNVLRGGIYASVCWCCLSNFAIGVARAVQWNQEVALAHSQHPNATAGDDPLDLLDPLSHASIDMRLIKSQEGLQMALICMLPFAFTGGLLIVLKLTSIIKNRLKQIRREYANAAQSLQGELPLSRPFQVTHAKAAFRGVLQGSMTNAVAPSPEGAVQASMVIKRQRPTKRTAWDKFFDEDWRNKVAFSSGLEAYRDSRISLQSRQAENIAYSQYLVKRGIMEHHGCKELMCYQLLLLRFVSRDIAAEKTLSAMEGHRVDTLFLLYAMKRTAHQETAGESLGRDGISAINLMEFNGRMDKARHAHKECVLQLKLFWNRAVTFAPHKGRYLDDSTVKSMMLNLTNFEEQRTTAEQDYFWLLEKYPSSASVLNAYAHFCDTVLNDYKTCEAMRTKAALLEGEDDDFIDHVEESNEEWKDKDKGSVSSDMRESPRVAAFRYVQSWRHSIMGSEESQLSRLKKRVRFAVAGLTILSLLAFVLLDTSLFNSIATYNMQHVSISGQFRQQALKCAHFVRDQMLAARTEGDPETIFDEFTDRVHQFHILPTLGSMKDGHTSNYEGTLSGANQSPRIYNLYKDHHIHLQIPSGDGWIVEIVSFWELLNTFVRRLVQASTCSVEELREQDMDFRTISERKKEISFVYRNLFGIILPDIEKICSGYVNEISEFNVLAQIIISVFTVLNGVSVLVTTVVVLSSLSSIRSTMQSKLACCRLVLHLPAATCKKMQSFYKHYASVENGLDGIEDGFVGEKEGDAKEQNGAPPPLAVVKPLSEERGEDDVVPIENVFDERRRDVDIAPMWNFQVQEDVDDVDADAVSPLNADLLAQHLASVEQYWGDASVAGDDDDGEASDKGGKKVQISPEWLQQAGQLGDTTQEPKGERASTPPLEEALPLGDGEKAAGAADKEQEGGTEVAQGTPSLVAGQERVKGMPHSNVDMANSNGWKGDQQHEAQPVQNQTGHNGILRPMQPLQTKAEISVHRMLIPIDMEEDSKGGLNESTALIQDIRGKDVSSTNQNDVSQQDSSRRHKKMIPFAQFMPRDTSGETSKLLEMQATAQAVWYNKSVVYNCAMLVLLFFSVFFVVFPIPHVAEINNLAPVVNLAQRRVFLAQACAYLARELILDDKFTWLSKGQLTSALRNYLGEFKRVDNAIKFGGDLGVVSGMDNIKEHSLLMYEVGCWWRNETQKQKAIAEAYESGAVTDLPCFYALRDEAVAQGLANLVGNFVDAVESIIATRGSPKSEWSDDWLNEDIDNHFLQVDTVDAENYAQAGRIVSIDKSGTYTMDWNNADESLAFILQTVFTDDGDVQKGLNFMVHWLLERADQVLVAVHFNLRFLFALFLIQLLIVFFYLLFLGTTRSATREIETARRFVTACPSHIVTQEEMKLMRSFFDPDWSMKAHNEMSFKNLGATADAPTGKA